MFKKATLASAVAFASLAAAAPASAAVINITANPDPCTAGDLVCTFVFEQTVPAGAFNDSGTFTLPQLGVTSGAVVSIAAGGLGDVTFSRVFLSNGGVDYDFAIVNGAVDVASVLNLPSAAGLWTITVQGNTNTAAGYSGDLRFTAVPEPTTWALLILGFGAAGAAMRRRSSKVRVAKTALNFA
jgi:hypothetical protein